MKRRNGVRVEWEEELKGGGGKKKAPSKLAPASMGGEEELERRIVAREVAPPSEWPRRPVRSGSIVASMAVAVLLVELKEAAARPDSRDTVGMWEVRVLRRNSSSAARTATLCSIMVSLLSSMVRVMFVPSGKTTISASYGESRSATT